MSVSVSVSVDTQGGWALPPRGSPLSTEADLACFDYGPTEVYPPLGLRLRESDFRPNAEV